MSPMLLYTVLTGIDTARVGMLPLESEVRRQKGDRLGKGHCVRGCCRGGSILVAAIGLQCESRMVTCCMQHEDGFEEEKISEAVKS